MKLLILHQNWLTFEIEITVISGPKFHFWDVVGMAVKFTSFCLIAAYILDVLFSTITRGGKCIFYVAGGQ